MRVAVATIGLLLIVVVLWDVFETIVLPRRVTRRFRMTRAFYRAVWRPWRGIASAIHNTKRRETVLSIFGPLSLIMLLAMWTWSVVFAFGLIHWALRSRITSPRGSANFLTDLYYSGTTFFTLGLGDVMPFGATARAMTVVEASMGIGMLAIVIGYFPVLYQAFSRREVNISMLDARAGTPPTAVELLRRHQEAGSIDSLQQLLRDWENWAADLMESHLSYPVLCFFRSQHNNQSWLASLSTVLDTCSLVMVGIDGLPKWQAQLTFKMARHAIVDIAQIFNTSPLEHDKQRLSEADLDRVRQILSSSGVMVSHEPTDGNTLLELRALYEPYVAVLARYLMMPLPEWLPKPRATDNWQTSAWEIRPASSEQTFRKCMGASSSVPDTARVAASEHHD